MSWLLCFLSLFCISTATRCNPIYNIEVHLAEGTSLLEQEKMWKSNHQVRVVSPVQKSLEICLSSHHCKGLQRDRNLPSRLQCHTRRCVCSIRHHVSSNSSSKCHSLSAEKWRWRELACPRNSNLSQFPINAQYF